MRTGEDRVCEKCGHPLPAPIPVEILELGDCRLDVPNLRLKIRGEPAPWPPEFGSRRPTLMLAELMRTPGRVWRYEALLTVMGLWEVQPHILQVYAYRVRQALRPSRSVRLRNVHGEGYVLECSTS